MNKKPYEESRLPKFIKHRILELQYAKSQSQIAREAGYQNPNMMTMIKTGASKLALDRVAAMAVALECDPAYLMRLALEQAVGGAAAQSILKIFGSPVSRNERDWLQAIRDCSNDNDPEITNAARDKVRHLFQG